MEKLILAHGKQWELEELCWSLHPPQDYRQNGCRNKGCSTHRAVVLKRFRLGTPQIILFEVGTPLYLSDSIPQIDIVKIADLKAHHASRPVSCLIYDRFGQFGIKKV